MTEVFFLATILLVVVVLLAAKSAKSRHAQNALSHTRGHVQTPKALAAQGVATPQLVDNVVTQPPQGPEYIYLRKAYLMTKHERYFYRRLHHIFGKFYLIFPQIHLNDLFVHDHYSQDWRAALSKIQRKSVDYVLCTVDLKIVIAIELDDYTHTQPARQQRDEFVERLFFKSGTPLVRFSQVETLTDQFIYDKVVKAVRANAIK